MADVPETPRWVGWTMERLLPGEELQLVLDELAELHAHWVAKEGRQVAGRRYRSQLRQYPFRLVIRRLSELGSERKGLMPVRGLAHAVRSLSKAPGLTTAIVATVGVGIGGCATIFAIIDVLFLRPLPYPDADRVFSVHMETPTSQFAFSVVDFQALSDQQTSFEEVVAYDRNTFTVGSTDGAERVQVASITPGYLELFGINLLAGRGARPEEGRAGAEPTIVVTPGFAERFMGGIGRNPSEILSQTVKMNGADHRVIGIAPDDFGPLANWAEAFPTLIMEPPSRRGPFFLSVFGRLRDGADPTVATDELHVLNDRLFPVWGSSFQDKEASWGLQPLAEQLQGNVDGLLIVLMGSVALLLLTATSNAANLLLARVGGRRRELAVRAALGASRSRMIGFLLTESALLAMGGVVLGLSLTHVAIRFLPLFASDYIPRLAELRLSGPVLGFAGALAVVCGILFGITSALQGSAGNLSETLRAGGRTATGSRGHQRAQNALVVGQLAVVVPLLAGAGLLLSSLSNLYRVDLGFDAEGLLSVSVPLDPTSYPDQPSRTHFWDQVLERVGAIPGVQSLGLASGRPPSGAGMTNNFNLEDKPTPPGSAEPSVPWFLADNGYFQTLGVHLLQGRLFEDSDLDENAPPVVLVDEAWADRFFPGEGVLGRRLVSGGCITCPLTTVVGVVGTVPYQGVQNTREGVVYGPGAREILSGPYLHVRAQGNPGQIVPQIRQEIRNVDSQIPLSSFATGSTLLRDSLRQPRHLSLLLGSFSMVSLILAVVGLYGIVSYSVQRRKGDIAIRLALGGRRGDVWFGVVWEGMRRVMVGLALGILGALVLTRILADLLFEVEPGNPLVLGGVGLLLALVSFIACAVPGHRAVRIDPASTLRDE